MSNDYYSSDFDKFGQYDENGKKVNRSNPPTRFSRDPQVTNEMVREELLGSMGNPSVAAARLGVSRGRILTVIENDPALIETFRQLRESRIDSVEDATYNNALNGDVRAQIFLLKTQGRSRGYGEVITSLNADLTKLTPAQLRQVSEGVPIDVVISESLSAQGRIQIESESGIDETRETIERTIDSTATSIQMDENDIP